MKKAISGESEKDVFRGKVKPENERKKRVSALENVGNSEITHKNS